MDEEKKLLLKMFAKDRMHFMDLSNTIMNMKRIPKPASSSEEARRKGNNLFSQKDHDSETHIEIFNQYCMSISLAPLESELLAQAYANRSAFLLHIQKYEECIKDIDRTLKFTKSDVLIVKLLCRKVECMKKMGLANHQSVLDTAENYAEKLGKMDKAQVDKIIKKVKACSVSNKKPSTDRTNKKEALPQMGDTLNCISIEYNEKYGRHIIAKKDYNPGDFIFSDDLYVAALNRKMNYTNCNYCLKICWSGIACDYCGWAMFCDEDCKKKAWDAYHDVECSVMRYLEYTFSGDFINYQFPLRVLTVGIKEAGSIDKLRVRLELVDQCKDICKRGFYKEGQFRSCTIESVYSLQSSGLPQSDRDTIASSALIVLMAIVKHSQLVKNVDLKNIDNLLGNEDLIFLGSLLIRFTVITLNADLFSQKSCHCERLQTLGQNLCCARGSCISPIVSLLNHSCNPNATKLFMEDKKVAIFALEPIKKNSQIFVSYIDTYDIKSIEERKKELNFTCECQACVESWPLLSDLVGPASSPAQYELAIDCAKLFPNLSAGEKNFDQKDIKTLCETIVKIKQLSEPNLFSGTLRDVLLEIYSRVYGWQSRISAFGKCDKA